MTRQKEAKFSPIAVVGANALFPGSVGGQSFWRNIMAGEDFMTEVPADHWLIDDYYDPEPGKSGKIYGTRGAFLPKVDFDPMEFGMPPKQLSTTDSAQLLGLIVASKVLEDAASVQFGKVDKSDISVILGVASATEMVGQMASRIQRPHWIKALRDAGIPESKVIEVCDGIEATYPEWDESTFPGLLGNVVAGRIANRLDLGGTNCVVDAACASSLGAVAMAIRELQSGSSNLVITGGVDALNDTFMYMCFSQTPALSPTGDCRPFSAEADGTMLGEGIGMVALRRLEDAERDGDRIYAVIRGVGSSSDGRSGSIYAPESKGQALAIRRAYDMTDYDVDEVELIEAHGTATKAGDAAEFGGLKYAFEGYDNKQWCALGSVKSQIGHTKSAAGSASLFKVVMALHHKVLPGTIKVSEPNPALNIEDSPFYLNTETRPWIHDPASTRKGSVSSFGFGGSNFHVTLEEYNQVGETRGRYHSSPIELLLLSGADSGDLIRAIESALNQVGEFALPKLAARLQQEFQANKACRLSILAEDAESAMALMRQAAEKIKSQPDDAFSMPNRIHYGVKSRGLAGDANGQPKIGFLFPGQGSQYVNMGAELACEFDQARRAWDIASIVTLDSEIRLDQVVYPFPVFNDVDRNAQNERLTSTDWAQPAIGCVSASMLNLLDTLELKPDAVAGHSYGEVTALYASGALKTPESLLAVSRRRGELMKRAAASTPGSMTAVRASQTEVQGYLDQWDCAVKVANINSPIQVVIAGETSEIEKAEQQLEAVGAAFRRLPVATAFHTSIVSPSAEPFHEFLADIEVSKPKVPVYSNTTASVYPTKAEDIRKTLARQLANPVRFQESIEQMHDDGIRVFLEVGPGAVLAGMVKECLQGREFEAISLDNRKQDGRAAFWNALGRLSAAGLELNFEALWQDFAEPDPLPESINRSPVTVKLGGANYGKPYPPENGSAGVPKPNPEISLEKRPQQAAAASPATEAASPVPAMVAQQLQEPSQPQSVVTPAPARDANWVSAFQSLQQQTLEAQKSFQQTLGDAHQAFLRASEVAFAQLGGVALQPGTAPVQVSSPVAEQAVVAHSPVQEQPVPVVVESVEPVVETPQQVVAADSARPAAAQITTPLPAIDFEAMLLEVVAHKTGYPEEMLSLDMELEAGLGIDSIKRVEILSSLQEQIPHLGEMDTAVLAELNTLGEIIELANASAPAVADSTQAAAVPVSNVDFEAMLLDVVADKTGYPKEMLSLDMELEAGLGIDSIKRVEILSSLQEQIPHLGEMDTAVLAELNTLGEIIELASGTATTTGEAAAPEEQSSFSEPAIEMVRFEVVSEGRAATGIAIGQIQKAAPLYLVGDRTGVAVELSDLLATAGVETVIRDEAPEDAQWMVLLTGLNVSDESTTEDLIAVNVEAFEQVRRCAANMANDGRLLVTVQSTGGDFGLSGQSVHQGWDTGIAALAKTAAKEWPDVAVKAVDVATIDQSLKRIAQELFAELIAGGPEMEVGLQADDQRITLVARPQSRLAQSTELAEDSVIVVSGGARGVTAACLLELLARKPAKLAVLGRTPLGDVPAELAGFTTDAELKKALLEKHTKSGREITPIELNKEVSSILNLREVRSNLAQLEATGSSVIYLPTDISDSSSVAASIAQVREELGPINVIVHAAGVLADKEIYQKTDEQFQSVFNTKVAGLQNLLSATQADPLTHLVCFSSVAARLGNNGQVDYAMANEILNRVCQAEQTRRGPEFTAKSIGWGPWAGGMVDPSLAVHFRAQGVELIPVADGARLFADEIEGRNGDCVEIIYGGMPVDSAGGSNIKQMSIRVQSVSHPQILSHLIQGKPVVPLAMVSEWCLGIATALNPGARALSVRDLSVLKGIQLEDFEGVGDWLTVGCERDEASGLINMAVKGDDGTVYYQLSIEIDAELESEPGLKSELKLGKWEWTPKRIYEEFLFHGEKLQVVKQLLGVSEAGCRGMLQMPDDANPARWRVAMLDGGLQFALLWERRRSGLASLPTKLGRLQWYQAVMKEGPVTCELILQKASKLAATWSIVFTDVEKQIIARMEDVNIHVLLGKTSAPIA
jgi:malonyl CoA-acyl carrier protein transacylase